ncbi:YjcZ family sporulation protein [Halobacillus amylolyticus]|uniref:YjcZ family sporulation protein n=1 Tax=Halobacillus amylolyticus TaxID=2932259 RepID=A0ABY4HHZ8_9BACI|nr:YjcZ family sporulation protein [Halobacillus amylolyticus]UOR13500.1 YjcZ family sporulation protein [Halobacillus amylolyticus]
MGFYGNGFGGYGGYGNNVGGLGGGFGAPWCPKPVVKPAVAPRGNGFALIVVLFILLIIIGGAACA